MKWTCVWGGTLLVLAMGAGCAGAPPRIEPTLDIGVPDRYDAAPAEPVPPPDVWWNAFGDETLSALIHEGLEKSPDLNAAAARVDAALAQARIAGADLLPAISAGASAQRRKQNFIGFPIPGSDESAVVTSTTNTYGVSLDASWEIDLWGRIRKGQSAARAEVEAVHADWMAARLSLSGQIASVWFTLLEARAQERLAAETVESFGATAESIRRSYERGVRSALDLRLALSDWATAKANRALRARLADQLERQLEILIGRYPAAALDDVAEMPSVRSLHDTGFPPELLERRPDVTAAARRAAAGGASVSEARRALYPRITLSGSTGTTTRFIEDITDGDFSVWSVIGGLTAPLFQGGRLRANVSAAEANEAVLLAQYVGTILRAFEEVESALVADTHLADRESSIATALEHAESAYALARDQYNAGLVDVVTLLSSQRLMLQRRSDHLSARRERLTNRVDVYVALGGGTPGEGDAS